MWRRSGAASTLVELLVVVAVIVVMMGLAVPAFNAMRGGTDFTSQLYDISGTLERARAYAMSSNSYTLVGIIRSPQHTEHFRPEPAFGGARHGGHARVTVAVIASKSGARPYQVDLNNRDFGAWTSEYGTGLSLANGSGSGFTAVSKLMHYQGLHLVDLQGTNPPPTSGNMMRPKVGPEYDIPNVACIPENAFSWPLGRQFGSAQYQFGSPAGKGNLISKVIEFDPQGSARIIGPSYWDAIPHYIEIGLQPAQGANAAAPGNQTTGELAAIQINGMNGSVRIYRP